MSRDSDFRVRPGKAKRSNAQGRNARGLVAEVLRVAAKISGGQRGGWGGSRRRGQSNFGKGRTAFARSRLFGSGRRVLVKALPVRHRIGGRRMAPLSAHVAYLKREGVTRNGSPTRMFDAESDRADDRAFAERCKDDRHHFRIIVSPEDAAELTDLREYTRDLVRQMETDLGTRLDWVAVDHWNTDNPHVHLLVRGVTDQGADLVMARDYISHGLRSRAEELAFAELGPKPEHEISRALDREVTAERWTRLDIEISRSADELGVIDLRPERPGLDDPRLRRLMIGRLQHLETMGLAAEGEPGRWAVAEGTQARLRELAARGDIIRTIGQALKDHGRERPLDSYAVVSGAPEKPIAGRLIDKGLHDELTGTAYAVIDGTDGRTHHVRLPGIEALEHSSALGGIVELRATAKPGEPKPTLFLATRSDLDLAAQIRAPGATARPSSDRARRGRRGCRVRRGGAPGDGCPNRSPRPRRPGPALWRAHGVRARADRHTAHGRVLLFDPTNAASAAYNPLLEVRRGEKEVRDVQNVADVLVDPEGSLERRNHWEKTSHSLLVGAILHVLYAEPDKTLAGVASFLSDPSRTIEQTLAAMMATPHLGEAGVHPVVASAARELLNKSDNERSGVLSTAMSFLGLYRDPVVAQVTRACHWRVMDLIAGEQPTTLYVVIPPSDISRTKPLIRLMLNQIGRRLTEELNQERRHRLLLMLDEFPALGRLDFFESALGLVDIRLIEGDSPAARNRIQDWKTEVSLGSKRIERWTMGADCAAASW